MSFADDDTQPISMPLTALDIDAIEARAKAATPGPWHDVDNTNARYGEVVSRERPDKFSDGYSGELVCESTSSSDGAFIAAARTDIPALVARVRELTALLMSAQADRDALLSSIHDRESFDRLLARSSLGTPGAVAVRASADPEAVAKILARVAELEADGMTPDGERLPGTYCGEWNGPCYRMLYGTCPNCGRTRGGSR